MMPFLVDQPIRGDRAEKCLAGPWWQAPVQWKRSVALVPDQPKRVDELLAAGKIDRNKVRHGEKATVTP